MIQNILHAIIYLSAGILAVVCIYTAASMNRNTCVCIKRCYYLIVSGLVGLVLAVWYDFGKWASLLSVLPIFWGITGWLMFDRYRAHESLGRIYDQMVTEYKDWKRRISSFFRKEAVSE